MKKQLLCGAGKAQITPPEELLPQMITLGGMTFGEINDDLFVRAIALDNGERRILMVCFELDKAPYPQEYTKLLSEATGVGERDILFFAIHTHTAPLTGYRPFEPKHDITKKPPEIQKAVYAYEALVREQMLCAAKQAVFNLQPAVLGFGQGRSNINVNRCGMYTSMDGSGRTIAETGVNPNGPVDHTVSVLRINDLQGQAIAFFVNFPVHCVTMFQNDRGDGLSAVSSDIGGRVSQWIETHYPQSVAIWCSGAAGDVNPVMMTLTAYPNPTTGEPVMERIRNLDTSRTMMTAMASRHYVDVRGVINGISCDKTELDFASSEVWVEVPAKDDVLNQPDGPVSDTPYRVRLHMVRLGDLALIGVNGELFTSLGRIVQAAAPVKNAVIINHEASLVVDGPGYILDDATALNCQKAQIVRLPNNGFRAVPGYLANALENGTRELFQTAN